MRTAAVEGMAKLMLSGGVQSSALLSRLLLLWYNPLTEEDVRLRSCLGVFFPIYAFSSRYCLLNGLVIVLIDKNT